MSGLFWRDRKRAASEAQAARFKRPEDTGERLVAALRAWILRALECLPPEARALYQVEPHPAPWLDTAHPHLVIGECERLVSGIPAASPGWIEWTSEQARAVAVLHAAREAVRMTRGVPAPAALLILDRSIELGIQAARAHVEPWEAYAEIGEKQRRAGNAGHVTTHGTPEEKAERWAEYQNTVAAILERAPRLSLTAARQRAALELGVSFSTIKRRTSDPRN